MRKPAELEIPEWQSPPVPLEHQKLEIAKQLSLLDSLRKAVEEGTIAAISCVVVRANMVPEHAFALSPYSAAILLAGMEMAKLDLQSNARKAMMQAKAPPQDPKSNPLPAAAPSDAPQGASSG